MGWESFGVVTFDLGPLLQGQMRIAKLKVLISRKHLGPLPTGVYLCQP